MRAREQLGLNERALGEVATVRVCRCASFCAQHRQQDSDMAESAFNRMRFRIYWDVNSVGYTSDTYDAFISGLPDVQVCKRQR